jgi:hypothetical protein
VEVIMVSFKHFYYAKFYVLLMVFMTLFIGCSKKDQRISKVLAFAAPLGCMVGAAIGKKLAGKNANGTAAGAIIGGTAATAVSIATGGILYAAGSAVFSAITTSLFKHRKKAKDKGTNKITV